MYSKVSSVIESDTALKQCLRGETSTIHKKGGDTALFPVEVVRITDQMAQAGYTMQTISRTNVLRFAAKFLVFSGSSNGSVSSSIPMSKPETTSVATVTAVQPAGEPPVKRSPGRPRNPVDKGSPAPPKSAPVAVQKERSVSTKPESRPVCNSSVAEHSAVVASSNLFMSLLQLNELDSFPGHEKRREKLDALAKEYEELTRTYLGLVVKRPETCG